jgi:hypothetical protein
VCFALPKWKQEKLKSPNQIEAMANLCINSCRVDKQNLLNLLIRSSFDGSK